MLHVEPRSLLAYPIRVPLRYSYMHRMTRGCRYQQPNQASGGARAHVLIAAVQHRCGCISPQRNPTVPLLGRNFSNHQPPSSSRNHRHEQRAVPSLGRPELGPEERKCEQQRVPAYTRTRRSVGRPQECQHRHDTVKADSFTCMSLDC